MKHPYVLGIHPSSRGFGWALFEGPLVPFDWGTVETTGDKNADALSRFKVLLDKFEPHVVAMEAFDSKESHRRDRIRELGHDFIATAKTRGIKVRVFQRSEMSEVLGGAETRDEVAAAVAERVAVLRDRLPEPRKPWTSEHPNIALFQAAACALTYLLRKRS